MQERSDFNPPKNKKWYVWLFVAVLAALLLSMVAGDAIKGMFASLIAGLTPIIVAFLIAVILLSPMNYIERVWFKKLFVNDPKATGKKRALSLTMLYMLLLIAIGLFFWLAVPGLIEMFQKLLSNMSTYVATIKSELTSFIQGLSWFKNADVQGTINNWIDNFVNGINSNAPIIISNVLDALTNVVGLILSAVIGVVLSLFLLKDKEKISKTSKRFTYAYASKTRADDICAIARSTNKIMQGWVIGNVIVCSAVFVVTLVGLLIIGAPHAAFLALAMAVLSLIPYLGGIIGGVLVFLLTLVFANATTAFIALIFSFSAWAIITGILPVFVMSKALKINMGLMLFALVIGGALFGIWGMVLAAPLVAVIQTILKQRLEVREKRNEQEENTKTEISAIVEISQAVPEQGINYEIKNKKTIKKKDKNEDKKNG